MIILITESYGNEPKNEYYVESNELDDNNPLDRKIKRECSSNKFTNTVFVNANYERTLFCADKIFWANPHPTRKKIEINKQVGFRPDKHVKLIVCFEN